MKEKKSKLENKLSGNLLKTVGIKKPKQKTKGLNGVSNESEDCSHFVKPKKKLKSKISDKSLKPDKVKKKKRKMSPEITESSNYLNTDVREQPPKKKRKKSSEELFDHSETLCGHVSEEKSHKLSDVSEKYIDSSQEKKRKKKNSGLVSEERSPKNLSVPANESLLLNVNDKARIDTHLKKGKKKKKEHVLEEISHQHLSAVSRESLPSDVSEDDNDSSQERKRKRRKDKQHIPEGKLDSSKDSGTVLIKKKKDKKKKRKKDEDDNTEESEDARISAQAAAVNYLKTWSDDKDNWKFQKVRQVWLLQHMYDDSKIPSADFERLLLYLENLKGKAKEETLAKASKIIEAEDSSCDESDDGQEKTTRARQVIQMLN